jgi:hypothetical protein
MGFLVDGHLGRGHDFRWCADAALVLGGHLGVDRWVLTREKGYPGAMGMAVGRVCFFR